MAKGNEELERIADRSIELVEEGAEASRRYEPIVSLTAEECFRLAEIHRRRAAEMHQHRAQD